MKTVLDDILELIEERRYYSEVLMNIEELIFAAYRKAYDLSPRAEFTHTDIERIIEEFEALKNLETETSYSAD